MARRHGLHLMKLFFYTIFFTCTEHLASCSGAWAKHPIHKNYERGTLVDEDVCNPLHKKEKLDFAKMTESALIIEPGSMFDRWSNRTYDLQCKFVVKAPKGEHLFANIQIISFRKNEDRCIDWVKFRRKDRLKSTEEICGNFQKPNWYAEKLDYFSSNEDSDEDSHEDSHDSGIDDPGAEIETTIYVSKENLRKNEDEKLRLVIVYTPYKYCDKPNSDTSELSHNVCLPKRYRCDGILNCYGICNDEENCSNDVVRHGAGTVTISAVSTIIVCFILFLIGLWFCRRFKLLCWSSDCAGPSSHEGRHSTVERHSSNSANQSIPSAPMLDVPVQSPTLDKDLPPSYDSLFPEQSNQSAT